MQKERFGRYGLQILDAVAKREISYQEFCIWAYINYYCGTTKGKRNPFKRGQIVIAEEFGLTKDRVQKILGSLVTKGFLQAEYRVSHPRTEKISRVKTHAQAWMMMREQGGRIMKTYYYIPREYDPK